MFTRKYKTQTTNKATKQQSVARDVYKGTELQDTPTLYLPPSLQRIDIAMQRVAGLMNARMPKHKQLTELSLFTAIFA